MKLALIPARAGSKRIKHKNIRDFCGKPLIAYTIETAIASKLFDDIVVSTDSEEIADIAVSLGATVPFLRPAELADDYATTRDVIDHAITALQEQGKHYEYCCCIYATSPLLKPRYLTQSLDALQNAPDKAFAFSVAHYDFPVQRALKLTENGGLGPMFPHFIDTRSQDLVETVHDAGQFYWGRCEGFLSKKVIFSEHAIPILLPRYAVQDIDTEEDWKMAELLFTAQNSSQDSEEQS
ncbi:MAG: pseudaminic acid cytidylyltransferase [Glaciecola sp.]